MTIERTHVMMYDQDRDHRKQLRCITNEQRLTEEDSIFWFDLCDWQFTEDKDSEPSKSERITTPVVTGHQ